MAEVNASVVKKLRDMTGVGMMECKKALAEANGDMDAAIKILRERGAARAEKRSDRATSEGLVHAYIHAGSRVGVLIEINCETDFVARTDQFKELANDLAMQVVANPQTLAVDENGVSAADIENEKEIYRKQAEASGKPADVIEKMVEGRVRKYYEEVCLLDQPFIRDTTKKVRDVLQDTIQRTGENIAVKRFARFELGEEAN